MASKNLFLLVAFLYLFFEMFLLILALCIYFFADTRKMLASPSSMSMTIKEDCAEDVESSFNLRACIESNSVLTRVIYLGALIDILYATPKPRYWLSIALLPFMCKESFSPS